MDWRIKMDKFYVLLVSVFFVATGNLASTQQANTTISYQGTLDIAGAPASGSYDFRAVLYDSLEFGDQASPVLVIEDVEVTEGLVNLALDFGLNVFIGEQRFLQLEVRDSASTGNYTLLQPRQEIFSAPYSISTSSVDGNHLRQGVIGECDQPPALPNTGSFTFPVPFSSPPQTFLMGSVPSTTGGCAAIGLRDSNEFGFSWVSFNLTGNAPCSCIHWLAIGPP